MMRHSVTICLLRGLGPRTRSLVNVQVAQRHFSATKSIAGVPGFDLRSYKNILRYTNQLQSRYNLDESNPAMVVVENRQSELYRALQAVWHTVCITGHINLLLDWREPPLIQNISLKNMDGNKLLKVALHLNRGTDASQAGSTEIDIPWMNPEVLNDVKNKCEWRNLSKYTSLEIKPVRCVLHTCDSPSAGAQQVSPTNNEEGFVGSLVAFLGSEFTGGELEITNSTNVTTINGANTWAAMRGECQYKLLSVTSGVRAALIYDIYEKSPSHSAEDSDNSDTEFRSLPIQRHSKVDSCSDSESEYESEPECDRDCAYSDSDCECSKKSFDPLINDECMYPTYNSSYSHWKETSDLSASTCVLRSQEVPMLVQQRVFAALKTELKKHSAVIIALQSLYENGETTDQLCDDDVVLYNVLSEQYHVELVMANVCTYLHFPQGALYSADIIRAALSKSDSKGDTGTDSDEPAILKPRPRPPKLIVPNQMKM